MSDVISRQTAVDELVKMLGYCFQADEEVIEAVVTTINELPPSQLSTNLAEVGTDAISRQAAIDYCYQLINVEYEQGSDEMNYGRERVSQTETILHHLELMPPAQPQIVRCKDCKHWIPYDWMFSEMWQSKNIADYPEDDIGCDCSEMAMKANDFCSRGKRRTE